MTERLLILGGTGEAAELARAAVARFGDALEVTTSLAGRTEHPRHPAGHVRIGGFGGPAGLAAYLTEHGIGGLIDATHPFATRISAAARLACERAGVPRLVLRRPPWRCRPLDRWIEVDDLPSAAASVGRVGRRAWLTIGASEIAAFSVATAVHFLVRLVDSPRHPLPLRSYEVIVGRGPFSVVEEHSNIERHAIDVLVCKASGGEATEAKIIAARQRDLRVIMVRRPPPEPGEGVDTVEEALDWLAGSYRVAKESRVS
jgi:precorrin-6A/cobalt-precorrin-6A reductase